MSDRVQETDPTRAALRAHARGAVETIVTIAIVRQIDWQDALESYVRIFQDETAATLERRRKAQERRAGGGYRR